jgi:hypothetical protein
MVDVILVLTKKGSGDEQCSDVHNNIKVESAEIDSIPATGEVFDAINYENINIKCTCLRIYSKMERVDHYAHVIFAAVSGSDEFGGTCPEIVKEVKPDNLIVHDIYTGHAKELINELTSPLIDDGQAESNYIIINIPAKGGDDFYHIFNIVMVEYDRDGNIIKQESMGFAVTSPKGLFKWFSTIIGATEMAVNLIKKRENEQAEEQEDLTFWPKS